MPESPVQYQVERTPEGHFVKGQSGNPAGKPPGCRNHASRTAEILLDSEVEALTRKAMALAMDGDALALRLCLDRIIAPRRERPVRFALPPIGGAADLAPAMAAIAEAVAAGTITTGEAFELAQVVDTFIRAIEAGEIEARLERLESVSGVVA